MRHAPATAEHAGARTPQLNHALDRHSFDMKIKKVGSSRVFRTVLMVTWVFFWSGLSIWAFHAILSSTPLPTELRRLTLRATAGILLSCSIFASRQFWSFFGIKNRSALFVEGIFILNVSATLFLCIGWLTVAWGTTVPRDSLLATTVSILIGLGFVVVGHWMFERNLSSYMQSERFARAFGRRAV